MHAKLKPTPTTGSAPLVRVLKKEYSLAIPCQYGMANMGTSFHIPILIGHRTGRFRPKNGNGLVKQESKNRVHNLDALRTLFPILQF